MGQKNLPVASGVRHVKALNLLGWDTREVGAHIILGKAGSPNNLSIPNHDEVKRQLLAAQLKVAGISEAQYLAAFHGRARRSRSARESGG